MNKEILFNEDARKKIIKGLSITAKAVGSTLGPRGQNVIFEDSSFPTITKDGVTVAQQVFLEDKFENMGVMMAREAAQNTNREAGDGTTTTVVLLNSMVNEADKYITAGMNPILIKRGMDYAKDLVIEHLKNIVVEVSTPEIKRNIATISANNDSKLGNLIAEVIDETGIDGIVTVQTTSGLDIDVEYIKGMRINSGYESHMFINNQKRLSCNMDDPAIVITTDTLTAQEQLIPLIERLVVKGGKREIVLFANRIEGAALAFLVQNHMLGKFTCVPIRFSSFGDYKRDLLYDMAALTQATVLGEDEAIKLRDGGVEHAGTCNQVIITRDMTIISGGKGDVTAKIDEVKALLNDEKDTFRIEKLKDRLGRLTGSIANIKVGGASETEQIEIKYRIEDALNATKSAVQEGIVAGGGTALLNCYNLISSENKNKEFAVGIEIVKNALLMPLKTIVNNGGGNGEAVVGKVLDSGLGYNALTEEYGNLIDMGVIDPFKVVKNEIINSVATAGIMITSGTAITIKPEKK